MKSTYHVVLSLCLLFFGFSASAQNKLEREHRIKRSQFPSEALQTISENNKDFKRLKFYKEVDSVSKRYTAKFKKARLFYEMDFNEKGELEGLGFAIRPVDMPEESFSRIMEYLSENFEKSKVRKMFQSYSAQPNEDIAKTLKNTFQNLMIPSLNYRLIVRGKKEKKFKQYEILFNVEGGFESIRESLPPNYDHVLY